MALRNVLDVVVGFCIAGLSIFLMAIVSPGWRALWLPLGLGVFAFGLVTIAAALPAHVRLPKRLLPLTLVGWLALVLAAIALAPGSDIMEFVSVIAVFAVLTGVGKLAFT